ncbi:hypothetical protein MTR_4g035540 [Medicago truncatula]|uniref:Uncharacterized protein n=1 Tax=Medicago truncatula TaxID=3880 RepID=G7JRE1_MEDTR|nr:hypothetical protein MTR_4g035540 [Medicago truncatula]
MVQSLVYGVGWGIGLDGGGFSNVGCGGWEGRGCDSAENDGVRGERKIDGEVEEMNEGASTTTMSDDDL